jgi:hypothetical protein
MTLFEALAIARGALANTECIVLDTRQRKMVSAVPGDLNCQRLADAYNKLADVQLEMAA